MRRIALILVTATLAGCATAPQMQCRPDAGLTIERRQSCEASPNPPPGCVRGITVGAACKF